MDLFAFAQIGRFAELMNAQGIDIPRLRGVRWMKEEAQISEEEICDTIKRQCGYELEEAVTAYPRFAINPLWYEGSLRTDALKRKYIVYETEMDSRTDRTTGEKVEYEFKYPVGIRWELVHGKNRKHLKYILKRCVQRVRRQMETHNKYAGREDVLQIHARIGSNNWFNYDAHLTVEKQPWFLEEVDDAFDYTYCDIYVKIDSSTLNEGGNGDG